MTINKREVFLYVTEFMIWGTWAGMLTMNIWWALFGGIGMTILRTAVRKLLDKVEVK